MNIDPLIIYPGNLHYAIFSAIQFFGTSVQLYWKITASIFIFILIFIAFSNLFKKPCSKTFQIKNLFYSKILFISFITIGILILRSPNFILFEQNPDESQWMVGAATLIKDPRFWLSVDGTTSGPLVIFPLAMIHIVGGSINYATVRLFGLLVCIIPSVLFTYAAFVNFFDDRIARIIILPLAIFMALINYWDFIAYNSEHIPIFLISVCIFIYSKIFISRVINPFHLILIGFFLGCIPYSKLQAVSIGLTIAFFTYLRIIIANKKNLKSIVTLFILLTICGLLPSCIVLFYLWYNEIFADFWQSFLLTNLTYAKVGLSGYQTAFTEKIFILPYLVANTAAKFFFISAFIIFVTSFLCLVKRFKEISLNQYEIILFSFALCLSSYYAAVLPGNKFQHYIFLVLTPTLFLTGTLFGIFNSLTRQTNSVLSKILLPMVCSLGILVPSFYMILQGSTGIEKLLTYHRENTERKLISDKIMEYAKPNEKMAIWGWMNNYYIETGLIQGTRDPHTRNQIEHTKYQKYYIRRYVGDLIKNKPEIFLDAVAPKSFLFKDRNKFGYEQFYEIKEVINKQYEFVAEVDGVRIFTRKGN